MLTYGSVRGVPGNRHPYRDPFFARAHFCHGLLDCAPKALVCVYSKSMTSGTLASVTEYLAKTYHPRFRIPDITVVAGAKPAEPIFTTPPFLCIEVLSKDDNVVQMKRRVDDYLTFGVPYVWLIDSRERRAWSCNREKTIEVAGALTTSSPEIRVPLAEMFSSL